MQNGIEYIQNKMLVTKLERRLQGDRAPCSIEKFITKVEDVDPTENNKYFKWIVHTYIKGGINLIEDMNKLKNTILVDEEPTPLLLAYHNLKHKLEPAHRDINNFRELADFIDLVNSLEGAKTEKFISQEHSDEMHKQAKIVLDTDVYKVVCPLTEAASCFFGVNTQWCTAGRENNEFSSYSSEKNPLYIILHKPTNTRWQFHWPSEQFMDERDQPINLWEFFKAHPDILEVDNFNKLFEFTNENGEEGFLIRVPINE